MKPGLSGLDEVLKNLNKAIGKIELGARAGLIEAGVLVRNEGQIQTPVEFGNLIHSWYGPTIYRRVSTIFAEIGLTAVYAPFVHEMVGANFTGPRPSSKSPSRQEGGKLTAKAKFLEDPLKKNARLILQMLGKATGQEIK